MIVNKKVFVSIVIGVVAFLLRRYLRSPSTELRKSPVVQIGQLGKVEGIITSSRDGKDFFQYLGIPYAMPPILNLRYEPPEPYSIRWEGIRDASKYGAMCIQVDPFTKILDGDEDCLTLNVHVPKDRSNKSLLPVLVWFHGGLFSFGSGEQYQPDYFMDGEDVIVITVNYRLASFGFLNTGDGLIRGNMGLKDQTMALRWVKNNIEQFGGNKNSVTIFGESAGGASTHYHLLSPMSEGLFQKAIVQSGLSTCPWALYNTPEKQAKRFASKFGCSTTNTKEMINCLKGVKATEIALAHDEMNDPLRETITVFVPTIEKEFQDGNTFLAEQPKKLIESGKFNKNAVLMAGVNSEEGLLISAGVIRNSTLSDLLESQWEWVLPRLVFMQNPMKSGDLEKVKNFYFHEGKLNPNPMVNLNNLTNLISDFVWKVDFHNTIKSHVQHTTAPIFLYYYTYESEFTLSDILLALKGKFSPVVEIIGMKLSNWFWRILGQKSTRYGVCHGDELSVQFVLPFAPIVSKDSKDYEFSKDLVKLWVSFAKSGSGSKSLEFQGETWSAQEKNQPLRYMQIDRKPKFIPDPFSSSVKFWNFLLKV